jgi:lipopolysaccharide export system protein LptA
MRRISLSLALAALLLSAVVGFTYEKRLAQERRRHLDPTPQIAPKYEAKSPEGWTLDKHDPQTGRPVVRVEAESFEGTHDPSTFEMHNLKLRLFSKQANTYTFVKAEKALYDEASGMLNSAAPVQIVINVPNDKNADDPAEAAKRVRVTTTDLVYDTKSGKAKTDALATFLFPDGSGQAVGVDYDPNTKTLHLRSQISLNWVAKGPEAQKMHVETADLVYKEGEQKVYLSPWSKFQRETTVIQAQSSVVTLQDGVLHQIDAEHPIGTDDHDDRHTDYSAEKMTALFDEDGNLVQIVGNHDARVSSSEPSSRTTLTGDHADMRFALAPKQRNGVAVEDSQLHLVLADGHAVAESSPLPQPGVKPAETRILRSEHIELEMKPGGQDVQEIRAPSQAQLEFKPNAQDESHRVLDASRIRVLYGSGSYVDSFLAWNVSTHTDKAASTLKPVLDKNGKPQSTPPALTWSDQMVAKFVPDSNQIASIDQTGNFRYQEGQRTATAEEAFLEQQINRITLKRHARVNDENGSAAADQIVMNQTTGDMDAEGHVFSTHAPDKNQKPGTSMLDTTQSMQAQADQMHTRDNNARVDYIGHAVMWQGASRISANEIQVNRDTETLRASGNVVSELVDNKSNSSSATGSAPPTSDTSAQQPIYTVVQAPELSYRDDTRVALYTGGVKLVRDKMTVTAKQIEAYLTPKDGSNSNQSSLGRAIATGAVSVFDQVTPSRSRIGTGELCQYFTKQDEVILSGGSPQMVDSLKGVTRGRKLTYFSGDDHTIVEGQKTQLAFTELHKK